MPLHHVTIASSGDSEVIACLGDRLEVARLQEALPAETVLRYSSTAKELDLMLRAAGDRLRMVVVAPRDHSATPIAPLLRDFKRRRPNVALVAYCRPTHEYSRDLLDLAGAGVHEVIFRDATDYGEVLRQTLARAEQTCGAAQALERLAPIIPVPVRPLIEYCLYCPSLATSVDRVAAALGVHRKTLVNYSGRYLRLPPSAIILWCRLIIAAHLLETRRGSVERVALALDFPSATALRNNLRRYSGHKPAELRQNGMTRLLDAFASALLRASPNAEPPERRAG